MSDGTSLLQCYYDVVQQKSHKILDSDINEKVYETHKTNGTRRCHNQPTYPWSPHRREIIRSEADHVVSTLAKTEDTGIAVASIKETAKLEHTDGNDPYRVNKSGKFSYPA